MRLHAWVFSSILLWTGVAVSAAPVYRAGEPVSSARSVWHGEVSAGYLFTSHQLEELVEGEKTDRLQGAEVRALWAPLSWLAIGAQLDHFGDEKLPLAVKEYKTNRVAGLVKLTLSPDTTPRFYVLAGLGKSKHKLTYDRSLLPFQHWLPVKKDISFWMLGLGVEADVWKCVFVGAEAIWTRYNQTKLDTFYSLSSKTETDLVVRAGVRF